MDDPGGLTINTRPRFRLGRVLIAAGIGGAAILSLLWPMLPHVNHPPAGAVRVPDIADAALQPTGAIWVSDEEVMRFPIRTSDAPYLTNVRTGKTERIPAFAGAMEFGCSISPDGRSLLHVSGPSIAENPKAHHMVDIRRRDGTRSQPVRTVFVQPREVWLPDSLHWAELEQTGKHIAVHGPDGSGRVLALTTPIRPDTLMGTAAPVMTAQLAPGKGQSINVRNPGYGYAPDQFCRIDVSGDKAVVQTSPQSNASNSDYLCIDPSGARMAYARHFSAGQAPAGLATRLLRRLGYRDPARSELWVSRADGSQARLIGMVIGEGDSISPIGWLRSGKVLCFEFGDAFWTIQVD